VRPIARAAPRDKSMSRPRVNGPRSLITTIVEAPVRGFVTFTRVPNGSFLCAAVRPSERNGWPLAVPRLELYWVAFIEPRGHLPCVDAARTWPPNQVDTSKTGRVIMSLIEMTLSPIAALQKKSPSRGAGGLGGFTLGLLIFETKTHPVTVNTIIDGRIRFPQSLKRKRRDLSMPYRDAAIWSLLGEKRTSRGHRKSVAFDPTETSAARP